MFCVATASERRWLGCSVEMHASARVDSRPKVGSAIAPAPRNHSVNGVTQDH